MELTTIAKPYVNAIFAIAMQNQSSENWQAVLSTGADLANNKTLQAFIAAPNISKTNKATTLLALLKSILGRVLSAAETAFIKLLVDNNRINVLPSMLVLFDSMASQASDVRIFTVISAYQLSVKETQQVVNALSDKYKTTVRIDARIDPHLVGGVVIMEADKVTDISIRARTDALSLHLSTTH